MSEQKDKIKPDLPVIGITIGDVNGIGPEVIIKALSDRRMLQHFIPVIFGSTKVIAFYRKAVDADDFEYMRLKPGWNFNPKKINIRNCWDEMVEIKVGESTPDAGRCAYLALDEAIKAFRNEEIDAVVTAPINKKNIQQADFNFPGHTEFFAEQFGVKESLMFMISESLKVGVVTGHVPLNQVSSRITSDLVRLKLEIMEKSLRVDFGIKKPRIAVLGLNPHAGEGGLLGTQEEEVITPVIQSYKDKGHLVFGPFAADGFFGSGQYPRFDGILAMYHDQGLIPFKTLSFGQGVNFTAGLPIIRTSPDHGTGYEIAGKNQANANSLRAALYTALDIARHRKQL